MNLKKNETSALALFLRGCNQSNLSSKSIEMRIYKKIKK